MKKVILTLSLTVIMLTAIPVISVCQEKPKPKKDTVNIDTDAKPTFYYAAEEEKKASGTSGNIALFAGIAGAVVVIGAAAVFLLKKKK